MVILDHIKEAVTGVKPLSAPVFLKETSDSAVQLEKLKALSKIASPDVKANIERDIKLLEYGIKGENQLSFELKNSHMPMVVIHDLFFEHEGLTAQIDYLIITQKQILILKCKNLFGNITVDNQGNFFRTLNYGKHWKKEGIYSPITQNQRHMSLLKKKRLADKKNLITRVGFERYFDDFHKSIVVIANPKTVLDVKYAKKDVKNKIIRCDQLIDYIKNLENNSKEVKSSDKEMMKLAEYFLSWNRDNPVDYTEKYKIEIEKVIETEPKKSRGPVEETSLYQKLKDFRYEKSKEEGIKAYYIFTNAQLENIIEVKPKNLNELRNISGFGDKKCEKYGREILEMVNRR